MKHSLPHLHGLRAILAIAVIFFHTEPFKKYMHWKVLPLKTFAICGDVAVTGFFVLSGFLISYLLLHEQQKNINKENLIAVKKFYWRRILRIWPLYFMIIGLHTYLLPQLHIEDTIQGLWPGADGDIQLPWATAVGASAGAWAPALGLTWK